LDLKLQFGTNDIAVTRFRYTYDIDISNTDKYFIRIRALSAHSAAEFNILPGGWQHLWLVAIFPPKRWGKMDRNDCHTAWGNLKTLIYSLYHYTNYACFFSLFVFFKKIIVVIFVFLT
jgi:hypothetical protein